MPHQELIEPEVFVLVANGDYLAVGMQLYRKSRTAGISSPARAMEMFTLRVRQNAQ